MTRIMVCISPKFVIYVAYRLRCVWAAVPIDESPLELRRAELRTQGILNVAELVAQPSGKIMKAAGMVIVQPNAADGQGYSFITFEDEICRVDLIIRPEPCGRERAALRNAMLLLSKGVCSGKMRRSAWWPAGSPG
jgi:hypothetical protein